MTVRWLRFALVGGLGDEGRGAAGAGILDLAHAGGVGLGLVFIAGGFGR